MLPKAGLVTTPNPSRYDTRVCAPRVERSYRKVSNLLARSCEKSLPKPSCESHLRALDRKSTARVFRFLNPAHATAPTSPSQGVGYLLQHGTTVSVARPGIPSPAETLPVAVRSLKSGSSLIARCSAECITITGSCKPPPNCKNFLRTTPAPVPSRPAGSTQELGEKTPLAIPGQLHFRDSGDSVPGCRQSLDKVWHFKWLWMHHCGALRN